MGITALRLDEYRNYDATGLAELVAKGEVTPGELLDTALAAVQATNDRLNAVVAVFEEEARRFIDQDLAGGPFRGVPFLIKDLTAHYGGQPTGAGWPPRRAVTTRRKNGASTVRTTKPRRDAS